MKDLRTFRHELEQFLKVVSPQDLLALPGKCSRCPGWLHSLLGSPSKTYGSNDNRYNRYWNTNFLVPVRPLLDKSQDLLIVMQSPGMTRLPGSLHSGLGMVWSASPEPLQNTLHPLWRASMSVHPASCSSSARPNWNAPVGFAMTSGTCWTWGGSCGSGVVYHNHWASTTPWTLCGYEACMTSGQMPLPIEYP